MLATGRLEDHLDVAGAAHVCVDATVGAVGSSALLGGLVDLDVLDDVLSGASGGVLCLGVALGVLEEVKEDDGALLGPATLAHAIDLGLGAAADASVELAEGNATLLGDDIKKVALRLSEGQALERVGGVHGVLKVNTEVVSTALGAAGREAKAGKGVSGTGKKKKSGTTTAGRRQHDKATASAERGGWWWWRGGGETNTLPSMVLE